MSPWKAKVTSQNMERHASNYQIKKRRDEMSSNFIKLVEKKKRESFKILNSRQKGGRNKYIYLGMD